MIWKSEWRPLVWITGVFLLFFFLPLGMPRFDNAFMEAFQLAKWYAREHVILCLIPAFFIAGAIGSFISQGSVLKYLGPQANKILSYGVSSVSGSVLAVCSCTVLPLFSGIYRMGAGIGPATAFLYSGPAINVLAVILTAKVLGVQLGIARAVGAIFFSIIIGLLMHVFFYKEEKRKTAAFAIPEDEDDLPLWKNALFFLTMVLILVFANWGKPDAVSGFWFVVYSMKWYITSLSALGLSAILVFWLHLKWWKCLLVMMPVTLLALFLPDQPMVAFVAGALGLSVITSTSGGPAEDWFQQSWAFTKQIMPLLLIGVLIAGFLLGRPGMEGIIPSQWVDRALGGNSFRANLLASMVGAFMYFATLTEIPILQGLMGNGMGHGPALALLLSGPALSLPNMLVIQSVLGTKKTLVFVILVITMSTTCGMIFGAVMA